MLIAIVLSHCFPPKSIGVRSVYKIRHNWHVGMDTMVRRHLETKVCVYFSEYTVSKIQAFLTTESWFQ